MNANTLEMVRAFGQTLARTEWLGPEELGDYQVRLISKLLRHAQQTTDFYRDGFDFDLDNPAEIKRNWSAIPILTRTEAVANRERLFSRSVPAAAGQIQEGITSGSTGIPFSYRQNQISNVVLLALTERMLRWWKVDGGKPYARIAFDAKNIAPPPQGATFGRWHSTDPRGVLYLLSSSADVRTQMQWLIARKPAYVGAYSSLLKELAREGRRTATELRFELLLSFGTVVDDETRELCRAAFGAEIADTYGAMEAGHFAAQCPSCGEYHVSAEATHVEILRDDGSPAGEGEMGKVVVTSLYGYAMPLIRYEIGDLAEIGSARAPCRRGLPSLRRILGRYRNLFRFRDGSAVWPWPKRFSEFIRPKQYQVVQTDFDHIEIRYVPEVADQAIDVAALTACVRDTLGHPVNVAVRAVDAIPRSRSGKYEDFISHVPAP